MFDAAMHRSVVTSRIFSLARLERAAFMLGLVGLCTCASHPSVQRDLSKMPPGQVGFDDLCGLQSYFDAIAIKNPVRSSNMIRILLLKIEKRRRVKQRRFARAQRRAPGVTSAGGVP